MAFSTGILGFNGTFDDISSYRMRGVNRPILRRKGGPRAEQVKNNGNFINTRRNNSEWKGSIAAAKQVRQAMHPVMHLKDFNYSGSLNAVCKKIQQSDEVNEWGKRSILLSANAHQLAGFSLNKFNSFEQALRHPLEVVAHRTTASVQVKLPELLPGINLLNPAKHPQYQFIFSLGAVPDLVYHIAMNGYVPAQVNLPQPASVYTPWQWATEKSAAATINLSLNNWQEHPAVSLLFSVGIAFGVPAPGATRYVKYSGSAKLVTVF
jgi:hypothetical protein